MLEDFSLVSDIKVSSLRGSPALLYFYPNEDTPGCPKQEDAWDEFAAAGATVLGVRPDSAVSHVRFRETFGLPFTLLSDPDHAAADAYGVWGERSLYGKTYMGLKRSTFVIDAEGKVAKVMRKVKPETHAEDVLAVLRS
ncbi:MAG: peroxiredoxin [Gaiella sp.]